MCVALTLDPGANLSLDEITQMDLTNRDGVGMAWIDERNSVSWWKSLKVDPADVLERLSLWVDSPRLLHFRLSTAGGTRTELCHPFPISPTAICSPEGSTWTAMIHNGHWHRWQEVRRLLEEEDLLPDKGPWSDTRLAAFLAHENPDWLQALGGKVAVLDHSGEIKRLGDWHELRTGIMVSNKYWEGATQPKGGYVYQTTRSWKTYGSIAEWAQENADEKTDKYSVPQPKKAKELPQGNHGTKSQNQKARKQVTGDWENPDCPGQWFRYDEKTDSVVDVSSLYRKK